MSTTLVSRTANVTSLFAPNQGVIPLVVRVLLLLMVALILGAALAPTKAHAAVTLRVEARPVSAPINVFATVTDANGGAVSGLTAADFQVLVDGVAVGAPSFSLPPAQDTGQNVSIVFAMDYSSSVRTAALVPMQEAVIAFINSMQMGDYAAIVKFNGTNPNRASVVQAFTQIDRASGTAALINAVNADYPGEGSNVFDGTMLSVQQFTSPPITLPNGPKATVLVTDGGENSSSADINAVVIAANAAKIAVFTIGVGNFTETSAQQILSGLAAQTSASFYPAPSAAQIGDAYVQVSRLLNNEYLLTFQSGIGDCNSHSLELRVTGQAAATTTFTRCTPLLVPDVRSQTQAAATTELSGLGLVANVTQQASFTVAAGNVISQQPPVGTVAAAGTAVNLVVSSGPPVASSSGGGGAIDPMELLMGLLLVAMLWTLRVKGER